MFILTNSTPGMFVFFASLMNPDGTNKIEQLNIPGNNVPMEVSAAMVEALKKDMIFNWYTNFGIFTLTPVEMPVEPVKAEEVKVEEVKKEEIKK